MSSDISRRMALRSVGAAVIAVPVGGLLAGCGSSSSGKSSGSADLLATGKKRGYLRVAIANGPPYTKVNPDGTVTGCAPDVFLAVIKKMGVPKIQGIVTPYDSMIPGLQANRWDAITAGLFMKSSRCSQVRYAEPVIVSTESFGVPKGNPKHILRIADVLANPKLKIGVLAGAFEYGILTTAKVPSSQIVKIQDSQSGISAVENGRVDAYLLPTLSLQALQKTSKNFDITPVISDAPRTGSSAAFRQSDKSFVTAYNTQLAALKAGPEFAKILSKWGFEATAAKGVTTASLCKNPG